MNKIIGYEGLYSVSKTGEVFTHNRNRLKVPEIRSGYKMVKLYKNGKEKSMYVHRLVAMTYIPNPENKPQVNHIDGNKLNNVVKNLEWATAKENNQHAHDIGLNFKKRKLTLAQATEIRKRHKKRCKLNGRKALSDEFGISTGAIQYILDYRTYFNRVEQ